jgi:hypothetical protein
MSVATADHPTHGPMLGEAPRGCSRSSNAEDGGRTGGAGTPGSVEAAAAPPPASVVEAAEGGCRPHKGRPAKVRSVPACCATACQPRPQSTAELQAGGGRSLRGRCRGEGRWRLVGCADERVPSPPRRALVGSWKAWRASGGRSGLRGAGCLVPRAHLSQPRTRHGRPQAHRYRRHRHRATPRCRPDHLGNTAVHEKRASLHTTHSWKHDQRNLDANLASHCSGTGVRPRTQRHAMRARRSSCPAPSGTARATAACATASCRQSCATKGHAKTCAASCRGQTTVRVAQHLGRWMAQALAAPPYERM